MSLENSNREVFINGIDYTELESVGSCVDNKGNTYPLQTDGTPDTDNSVHFSDCEQEWIDGMSENDYSAFLEWHTDNNLSVYDKESK